MVFSNAYGITDISISNGVMSLHREAMTSSEIERQIAEIDYNGFYAKYSKIKDEFGAEKMEFPSIIYAFYTIVFTMGRLPRPDELIDEYYFLYKDHISVVDDGKNIVFSGRKLNKINLDARIARSYASLIRDVHFNALLRESGYFERVYYSCKTDISGKDAIVIANKKKYVISLFVQTPRSMSFKVAKNDHRHVYGSNEIQLPLDMNISRQIGDFYVYGKKDVETVKKIIEKDMGN